MIQAISDQMYRMYMFFFVPFALVRLALPGRDPLKHRTKPARPSKNAPIPVYLGPELGNKPYRAEVGQKRHVPYRRFAFAR